MKMIKVRTSLRRKMTIVKILLRMRMMKVKIQNDDSEYTFENKNNIGSAALPLDFL